MFSRNISASDDETDDDLIDIIDVVERVKLKSQDVSTDDSGLDAYELTKIFMMVSLLIIRALAIVTQLTLLLEP